MFLAWKLSQVGFFTALVCPGLTNDEAVFYWKTGEDSPIAKFTPDLTFATIQNLNSERVPPVDIVLLGGGSVQEVRNYARALSGISKTTGAVYLVDACYAVGLELEVCSLLQRGVCLSYFVDAGFRTEGQSGKTVHVCRESSISKPMLVGYSLAAAPPDRRRQVDEATSGKSAEGQRIDRMKQLLNSGDLKCDGIPLGRLPSLGSYCWKRIVPFVAFDIVSVVYRLSLIHISEPTRH